MALCALVSGTGFASLACRIISASSGSRPIVVRLDMALSRAELPVVFTAIRCGAGFAASAAAGPSSSRRSASAATPEPPSGLGSVEGSGRSV